MLYPEGVLIDGMTGAVTPETGRYSKRLSGLAGIFQDSSAYERAISERHDPLVYEVIDYRKPDSDLFFGTTTMQPGKVGVEYYMTRGHFHERRDRGEAYYTQSGEGLLLLESRAGETRTCCHAPWCLRLHPAGLGPSVNQHRGGKCWSLPGFAQPMQATTMARSSRAACASWLSNKTAKRRSSTTRISGHEHLSMSRQSVKRFGDKDMLQHAV
jgi:glucose-6-phosphate isomerase